MPTSSFSIMNTKLLRSGLLFVSSLCFIAGLSAQTPAAPKLEFPAPSPASTLKQRVGITDIQVDYSRPGVKGRKIFGGLETYGKVWRTGANSATKISFSTAVKLNGTAIPAGEYALMSIPGKDEWTVIINKVTGQWGAYAYDEKNDVARIKAAPVTLPGLVETFTIDIGDIRDESATLSLAWENTRVPLKLEVDVTTALVPQIEAVMASAEPKKPYLQAAMFYYAHDLDLKKALGWINTGIAEQPEALWMIYRKGLILAKMGDKAGALAAAQQSLALAEKASGGIKDEYTRLNNALIESLR